MVQLSVQASPHRYGQVNPLFGMLALSLQQCSMYAELCCIKASLGTNSSMFANCSGFGDVREVRSSVLGQNEKFGSVRSSILMFGELLQTFGP